MTIETKFNLGDKVWFMDPDGKVQHEVVDAIIMRVGLTNHGESLSKVYDGGILYDLKKKDPDGEWQYLEEVEEFRCFATKGELIASL